jgi:hypothetical protein
LWRDDHVNGTLTMTVSKVGKISAKVVAKNGTWTFKAPSWSDRVEYAADSARFYAKMSTKQGQKLALVLDDAVAWNDAQLTGTCNSALDVFAQRNPFLNRLDPGYSANLAAFNTAHKGYYTLAFENDTTITNGAALNIPEGCGYLTVTLNDKGAAKYAGKLATGQAVSGNSAPFVHSAGVDLPVFNLLYTKRGFFSDSLAVAPDGKVSSATGRWLYPGKTPVGKPPAIEDRFELKVTASGGKYTPPATLWAYYEGMSFIATNALVTVAIAEGVKGAIKLPANPNVATLKVSAKTGVFTGKFNLYETVAGKTKTTSVSHAGVLLPYAHLATKAAGYWLLKDASITPYIINRSQPVVIE